MPLQDYYYWMDESTLNFIYFLAVIGGLYFVVFLAKLLWALVKSILPSKNYMQRYGAHTWAVVTGGSDGIGLGFCEELAALGFNICMIARNSAKMEEALKKVKGIKEIQTKCILADFTRCQEQGFFQRIVRELEKIDVSILVNNVGISNIGHFHEIPIPKLFNQINVNIVPMVMMTRHLLPHLLKRQLRSAIINVSSVAGENPLPYIATYSATKAFNDFFSQSVEMECSHKLDVLSLRPMYVESNMSKKEKSCTVASRNQCASAALRYLGIDYETNGFFMHRFLSYLSECLPAPLLRCVSESQSRKVMEQQGNA